MNLQDAERLANDLLIEFSLDEWTFKFDRAKRRFGQCSHRKRTISLSKHLVIINDWPFIDDTIRHEIAHALTPGHRHDHVWQQKCIEVGAEPTRCYSNDVNNIQGRYVYKCPSCPREWRSHKRWRKIKHHTACAEKFKRYDERSLIVLVDSGDGLTALIKYLENK